MDHHPFSWCVLLFVCLPNSYVFTNIFSYQVASYYLKAGNYGSQSVIFLLLVHVFHYFLHGHATRSLWSPSYCLETYQLWITVHYPSHSLSSACTNYSAKTRIISSQAATTVRTLPAIDNGCIEQCLKTRVNVYDVVNPVHWYTFKRSIVPSYGIHSWWLWFSKDFVYSV